MTTSEQITCKPTPWFILRAIAMLAMFSVFAVLFYIDGTRGYQKKNLEYYLHATFQQASDTFANMNSKGTLTPQEWEEFAREQHVSLPEDTSILPNDTVIPLKWPEILSDYEQVKPLQPHLLWQKFSEQNKLANNPPEQPFNAGKIREQIIVFYICLALSLITIFFLVRTMLRSVKVDHEALTTAKGQRIPYSDMKVMDLRKWDTKGLALIDFEGNSGSGRARIDGLTYGGFKKELGEPAEQLIKIIRANFSGEIIEYTTVEAPSKENTENKKTD